MKKIIVLLVVITSLLSCSKDDNGNGGNPNPDAEVQLNIAAIEGKWNINKVIKADGSIVDYHGYCPITKDYFEIFFDKIVSHHYMDNGDGCNPFYNHFGCSDIRLNNTTRKISVCNDIFNGTVSSITSRTMRIDYDEVEYIGLAELTNAKGVIFTRQVE